VSTYWGSRYSYGDSDCIHLVIDALTAMGIESAGSAAGVVHNDVKGRYYAN
jgi:hypothetical protein